MKFEDYREAIDTCVSFAGAEDEGWNSRFLYCLDRFGLTLKPYNYTDPTGRGRDWSAPIPLPQGLVVWPQARIGLKDEIRDHRKHG